MAISGPWVNYRKSVMMDGAWGTDATSGRPPLPRYGGKGFALDCLSHGWEVNKTDGLPLNHSFFQVKSGGFTCVGEATVSGTVLAWLLVVLHVSLIALPLGYIIHFFKRYMSLKPTAVARFEWILCAMGVFSISALGETSQHIHDNWLYFGLNSLSYNNAVFYGGLALGQTLLVLGVGGVDWFFLADLACAFSSIGTLIWGAAATADERNPRLVTLTLTPTLTLDVKTLALAWFVAFAALFCTSVVFIARCWATTAADSNSSKNKELEPVPHFWYTFGMAVSYILGIFFSFQLQNTGKQWWHVPTAFSFIMGFLAQVSWVDAIMVASSASEKNDEKKRE